MFLLILIDNFPHGIQGARVQGTVGEDHFIVQINSLAITNTEITSDDHPSEWGLIDGFWLAMRFHVPIVLFTARDEWEPTNSSDMIISENARWTDVRVGGKKILDAAEPGTISIPPINPQGYANFVMALHWIAWPIILITVSRKLFRRS